MAKSKGHKWHCGICESDLIALKRGKGTKYLMCPKCDRITAYFNKGLLKKVAKGALRGVPFVGDITAELLSKDSPEKVASPPSRSSRMSEVEKVERIEKILKR